MTEGYCYHCGIRTEGNTGVNVKTGERLLICDVCGFSARFYILSQATKTDTEVETSFQNTSLTDSQKGTKRHSSPKKKND